MFEPRGHDIMSRAFIYLAHREGCDFAVIFIEVSGCLPMCGAGTIRLVTSAIEAGLALSGTAGSHARRRHRHADCAAALDRIPHPA